MMGRERSYLSRWCKECGVKLPNRNDKRRYNGYKVRNLCKSCFANPSDETRCKQMTAAGRRCKHRRSEDSAKGYCAFHDNRSR